MDRKEIKLYIDDESYLYDVQGLVMAFYPGSRTVSAKSRADADIAVEVPVGEDRKSVKNGLKRELYETLKSRTGKTLPWGTLTGVRPTKIVLGLLSEGMDEDDIISLMKREYLTSDEKARLVLAIALRESEMIEGAMGASYGDIYRGRIPAESPVCLYIGIPFCPSICLYCSFSSYAIGAYRDSVEDYLSALKREIRETSDRLYGRRIAAIYFGGGTPTSLFAKQLESLLETVGECFMPGGLTEYTVEAGRPDSITMDKLRVLSDSGVGRISINPQTLHQKTLDTIGRRHSVQDFYRAYSIARSFPFTINTDLIVGLPGEGEPEVRETLERIIELSPDNLTVHSLAKKRASRLTEEWDEYAADSFTYTGGTERMVYDAAKRLSMEPYYMYRQKNIAGNMENVGFSERGRECLYNVLMMEEACDIVAFGAGAVSKRLPETAGKKAERLRNPKDVKNYIERIDEVIEKKRKFF